jgi:GAF domain-containing protein
VGGIVQRSGQEEIMKEGELGRLYTDGEIIFNEGEKGESMYVIQEGKVMILKKTPTETLTIATLESGDIFGEMSLFDKLPRSATATACGEARVLSIDKKKLFSTISRDPTLVFKILETMSQRIRKLNENLCELKKNGSVIMKMHFSVENTCRMVLDEAKNIIKADNGSVMLLDDDSGLSIKSAFGLKSKAKLKLCAGEGVAGDVLSTGKAELVNNVTMDRRFKTGDIRIKSMLCVPLKYDNITLGVINMSNCSEKLFTIEDLKMLDALAIYASTAIQNARQFTHLKAATEKILIHASMLDIY